MNRKNLLQLILFGILLFAAWAFLSSFGSGKIIITAPSATPNNADVSVKITRNDVLEKEFSLNPGESRSIKLKKGTVRVDGQAGDLQAVDVVEIGKTKELITPSSTKHQAAKLGTNAVGCVVVLPDKVYSYSCITAGRVVKHVSQNQNETVFDDQVFAELYPIKNGLVGLYLDRLHELQFLDLNSETVNRIQLPARVQAELDQDFPLITTSPDPDSEAFALYFSSNKRIFVFKSPVDTSPIELTIPLDLAEQGRKLRVSFDNDKILVLAANIAEDSHDGSEQNPHEELSTLASHIFEFSADGTLARTIAVPQGFEFANGVYGFTGDYYALDDGTSLVFFYLENDKLREIYNVVDVSNWITLKDKAYVQTYGVFYEFVPAENGLFGLHSVFSSSDLSVSRLFNSVRGLVFTAFVNEAADQLNIYQLSDTLMPLDLPSTASKKAQTRFVGMDSFITYGITNDQVVGLTEAIRSYIDKSGTEVKQASVANIVVVAPPRGSVGVKDSATFDLVLDDTIYKAKIEYSGLTDIRLYIFSASGGTAFDSGAQ